MLNETLLNFAITVNAPYRNIFTVFIAAAINSVVRFGTLGALLYGAIRIAKAALV